MWSRNLHTERLLAADVIHAVEVEFCVLVEQVLGDDVLRVDLELPLLDLGRAPGVDEEDRVPLAQPQLLVKRRGYFNLSDELTDFIYCPIFFAR